MMRSKNSKNMNIWKKLGKTALMTAFLFVGVSGVIAAPFSDLSFEAALKKAGETGKIVLVDFYTTWCGPCKLLDKNTWTDPAVIQLLEQKTVALRVDAEKEVALAKRYKIEAYPSMLLIKPDGAEMDRLVGYKEPKAFMEDFNAALGGKDSISRAKDKMMAAGTNDPSARMQFGVALAQKGKNAEALSEYLWCFDHGLEAGPGFTGVRLSYLLSYIKNLSADYPPARRALETRRDERQAKVAGGTTDFQTIQDLFALNKTLGQEEKNLAVFDQLPADSAARNRVADLLVDQFLQAKRYADVLQGTDGKASFKKAVARFDMMLDYLKDSPSRKQVEENFRAYTVAAGTQYFEALAGMKRDQDGKDLAAQILKFDSSEATRISLAKAAQRAENTELAQYVKQ
jgi:thiol-disulfide isomerase/thioredoxin